MKRMFIVGKDAFLVTTMRMALKYTSEVAVFGVRDAGSGVRRALREARPDIVLLDGSDAAERTLERLAMVSEERPGAIVLVLATGLESDVLEELLAAGATVCLSRTLSAAPFDLLIAGDADAEGDQDAELTVPLAEVAPAAEAPAPVAAVPAAPSTPLTNREMEILRCVAEGHTNARIGRDLWVTEQTVKFHLSNIFRKLGVSNRTEASRYVLLNDSLRARPAAPAPALAPALAPPVVAKDHSNGRVHHVNGHRFGATESVR
ncbi:response regulator transcription factor [Baekduia soli]|uniref:Response regulator transcription factor n=1 Tax=Baekduia soli TaxID=496014 RepID=A0A5B8U8K9_9ACTN|nr:response regulator transcription factor [Baekduia soli]QEC49148.1 response regulator transcription factor [Baekduia soli]